MNSHLEQAIQQAMAELDKQTVQLSTDGKSTEKQPGKQTVQLSTDGKSTEKEPGKQFKGKTKK